MAAVVRLHLSEPAVLKYKRNGDGRVRRGEVRDILLNAVLEDREVLLLQPHDDLARLLVVDDRLYLHDVGRDFDDLLLLERVGRDWLLRLLRLIGLLLVGARVLLLRGLRRRAPRLREGRRAARRREGERQETCKREGEDCKAAH